MTEDPRLIHKWGKWVFKTPMIASGYWDTWQTWKEINNQIKYRGGQTGHDRREQHLQILHDFIRPCVEVTSLEDLYEMKSWVYWNQPSRGLRNTGKGAMYTKIKVEVNNQIMKLERQKDEIKPGANWIAIKGGRNENRY